MSTIRVSLADTASVEPLLERLQEVDPTVALLRCEQAVTRDSAGLSIRVPVAVIATVLDVGAVERASSGLAVRVS